jgi:hypothetical protein
VTRAEWIEAALIVGVALAASLAWPCLPTDLSGSQVVLGFAVLLLAQSLLRDVSILLRSRGANLPERTASCLCLESAVGATGVAVGLAIAGLGDFGAVSLSRANLAFGVAAMLALGLAIKDWVITWNPWGLQREKDHLNLILRWKR